MQNAERTLDGAARSIRSAPWATRSAVIAWGAIALLTMSSWPESAQAQDGLDACGNIHVEAQAECEVIPPSVECESMCTPLSVRATCSARLAADCAGSCTELPSVDCSATCVAECSAECTVDPGKFDCRGACAADCSGHCEAGCAANEDEASCQATCEGSCGVSCDSHCDVELPEADCDAGCEASCDGSCEVDTNLDCQIDCQAEAHADCEAEVTGGCKTACETEEGALFCDGQYVDHGNNLEQCLEALRNLDVQVTAEAHGSAQGSVNSSCSLARPGVHAVGARAWGVLGAVVALFYRRKRSGTSNA